MGVDLGRDGRDRRTVRRRPGGPVRQGFTEIDVLDLHVEGEDVAALAAAEAVEVLRVGEDDERGRLLLMERAEPLVAAAGALELHVGADQLDDVGAFADFGDGVASHGVTP